MIEAEEEDDERRRRCLSGALLPVSIFSMEKVLYLVL
jgi:hypothetical protein